MRAHTIGVSVSVSVASTQTCVLRASASPYSDALSCWYCTAFYPVVSLYVDEFLRGYVIITSCICHVFISQSVFLKKKKGLRTWAGVGLRDPKEQVLQPVWEKEEEVSAGLPRPPSTSSASCLRRGLSVCACIAGELWSCSPARGRWGWGSHARCGSGSLSALRPHPPGQAP